MSSSSSHINKRAKLSNNIKKCDTCDRTFDSYKQLNNHKRIHPSSSGANTDVLTEESDDIILEDDTNIDSCTYNIYEFYNIYNSF